VGRYKVKLNTPYLLDVSNPNGLVAILEGSAGESAYIYSGGSSINRNAYFTVETKTTPHNDTYYSATEEGTHTFDPGDSMLLKRTVEKSFTSLQWLVNGAPVTGQPASGINKNINITNTVKIPASILHAGENTVSMVVRYTGATKDSVYTGSV
jgi:hypothetical protein